MEKIKSYFSDMNREKGMQIGTVAVAAVSIIAALVFFFTNCVNLTATKRYNLYFAIIFIVMIALTVYLARILVLNKNWSYPRLFVIMAIGWTFCMQLVMPPISGPDEVQHYYSAYHCSNIMLGKKDHNLSMDTSKLGSWVQDESFFYMRGEDYYMMPYLDVTFPYQYSILAQGNFFKHSEELQDEVEVYIAPSKASRYLVSGAGITLARLLGFGFAGVIFMGRFFNSISLIIAGYIALKLLPVGKHQFFTFALFPGVLHLCSSYSYDNMSILFSLALFTLCLYYSQPHVKLHAWDLIILAGCVIILIPNKTVYALFAVWIFAIPIKKWWTDVALSKKWYEYGILAVMGAGVVVVGSKIITKYYYKIMQVTVWKRSGGIETDETRNALTLEYFQAHKLETLKFAWEGIQVDFWYNINHIVGRELGHVFLNAQVPMACVIIMLACLIIGMIFIKGKRIKKWQMVVIGIGLIMCVIAIFIGCMTRFTPQEGSQRIQISFRYLIPVYMCMCIGLGTDAKENKLALALIYIQNIALISSMCGLLNFLFHLRDGLPAPFEF
ncbi:DUF2142 domain-containing protein [Pseudobutyrivibrio sp.]|uniref:DUF2142 domain-containing protein n=1 Tax=Pseudobutyrivibrio sp. TaxID=2014367 RepID=UPI001B16DEDD|nr:DUF2142 domain-containing protein [Pseudobutyrivibrio sp.]MBO5617568.1 DUF2142 domain-containing protein [Pseudobutyrivibrio sp.]MBP3262359.1 DUF2142 domain-containing protein [Pseudobutyrivibrio sp.]